MVAKCARVSSVAVAVVVDLIAHSVLVQMLALKFAVMLYIRFTNQTLVG